MPGKYRVINSDLVHSNSGDIDHFPLEMFNMSGEFMSKQKQALKTGNTPYVMAMAFRTKENDVIHDKLLHYQGVKDVYVLKQETNLKNGKRHGLQTEYNMDGALRVVAMYQNNQSVCDMTSELNILQILDQAKGLLGIKRRDVDTRNQDQVNVLKKRHPNFAW